MAAAAVADEDPDVDLAPGRGPAWEDLDKRVYFGLMPINSLLVRLTSRPFRCVRAAVAVERVGS